jgi:NIMA (never in mitosis gene a)-related kinase
LSNQNQKIAENELALLKLLKGPTIIRYYDSFVENDIIHIVMEYAEKGSLHDKIVLFKSEGKTFTKDQIMTW